MIKRSCKGNSCISYLRMQIDELEFHHGYTWNDLIRNAVTMAQNLTLKELEKKGLELKQFKRKIPDDVEKFPTALQVTIEDAQKSALDEVEHNLKSALELTRLQSGLEIEMLLFIYLSSLKSQVMLVGKMEDSVQTEDLSSGPELVKKLVEILMLNREQDKPVIEKVRVALLEWEV